MRTTKLINIKNIKVDNHSISPQTFDLAFKIKTCIIDIDDLPPIKLQCIGNGSYKLRDGRHRITAFKLLGKTHIKSKFYKNETN